jgi:two-component system sensor histidine kinase RegB
MKNSTLTKVELDWLVKLRWLAVVGQSFLLWLAHQYLDLDFPISPIVAVIGVLIVSNVALAFCETRKIELTRTYLGSVLVFDSILLSLLLYWTGGPFNPFSIFYLVHIALAAVVLGTGWTWCLALVSSVCFGLLFKFRFHMGHHDHGMGSSSDSFSLHLHGMLVAFILTAGFITYFLTKLTDRLRKKEEALRQFQLQKLTNQRLASLATLSAGAAHELSTPLSTIAVVSKELGRELSSLKVVPMEMIDDASLIRQEVERCRSILDRMGAQSGQIKGELPVEISISSLFDDLKYELKPIAEKRLITWNDTDLNLVHVPELGLKQTLLALVRNGIDASGQQGHIELRVGLKEDCYIFSVIDTGCGMSDVVKERIGEPFYTTKEPGSGMGLGIFLANLFAESWGGELEILSQKGEGTTVRIILPRFSVELQEKRHAS